MGRPALDKNGSTQLAIRVPDTWLKDINQLIKQKSGDGLILKRMDILRMAMRRGLDQMMKEEK